MQTDDCSERTGKVDTVKVKLQVHVDELLNR